MQFIKMSEMLSLESTANYQRWAARSSVWFTFRLLPRSLRWTPTYFDHRLAFLCAVLATVNFVRLWFVQYSTLWSSHRFASWLNVYAASLNDHETFYHIFLFYRWETDKGDQSFPRLAFEQKTEQYQRRDALIVKL